LITHPPVAEFACTLGPVVRVLKLTSEQVPTRRGQRGHDMRWPKCSVAGARATRVPRATWCQ